ncbi:hypothetical protein B9J78_05330 [bacterium Unc6]|nr:hypothetical protein [bacterium Unc6]
MANVFVGRTEVSNNLIKRLNGFQEGYRQNIAIISDTGIGKTTLIENLLSDANKQIFNIFIIDVRETDLFSSICLRTKNFYLSDIKQTNNLLESAVSLSKSGENTKAFEKILQVSSILSKITGKKTLFIIEDFDLLERFNIHRLFERLSKTIMVEKDTMIFLTSSRQKTAKHILSKKFSLLFGNFEILHLQPFSVSESMHYIDTYFKNTGEDIKKFLIYLTLGYPLYLKTLSGLPLINCDTISESLSSASSSVYQIFKRKTETEGRELDTVGFNILNIICNGTSKISDIIELSKCTKNGWAKNIKMLEDIGWINRFGNFYTISVPLFGVWLSQIFVPEQNSPFIYPGKFYKDAHCYIEKVREDFFKNCSRKPEDILKSAICCFNGEKIGFEDEYIEIPKLESLSIDYLNESISCITGKNNKKDWFFPVSNKFVEEKDIETFLKWLPVKPKKCRIEWLALNSIGLNARIVAKESRINIREIEWINLALRCQNIMPII